MKNYIRVLGVLNLLFAAFHVFLAVAISRCQLPPEALALMKMLNYGGSIFILFMAVSMLFLASDVVATKLGRMVVLLGAATYIVRAIEEVLIAPHANPLILATCAIVGLLHLGAYAMLCRTCCCACCTKTPVEG
jgi:hypothetical protein